MWIPRRVPWAVIVVLLLVGSHRGIEAESPNPVELIDRAAKQEVEDARDWYDYEFRRKVVRQSLDADGGVTHQEELVFRCTPTADGFDETLIEHDGNEPSQHDVNKNREAARFSNHLKMAITGSSDPDSHESFTAMLTGLQKHEWRHEGVEEVNGRQCHRLEMMPSPQPEDVSLEERLVAAEAGTLWIETESLHIVRAAIHLSRPVAAYGLVHLEKLVITVVSGAVPEGGWLPKEMDVRSEVKIPAKHMRKRNYYVYSDHRHVGAK